MAEMMLVDAHPNGCVACQSPTGPFVIVALAGWTVNTVQGPFQVDTDIVFCAARDGREGCAGQLARTGGYVSGDEHALVVGQYADGLDLIAKLEVELAQAKGVNEQSAEELADKVAKAIIAAAG